MVLRIITANAAGTTAITLIKNMTSTATTATITKPTIKPISKTTTASKACTRIVRIATSSGERTHRDRGRSHRIMLRVRGPRRVRCRRRSHLCGHRRYQRVLCSHALARQVVLLLRLLPHVVNVTLHRIDHQGRGLLAVGEVQYGVHELDVVHEEGRLVVLDWGHERRV